MNEWISLTAYQRHIIVVTYRLQEDMKKQETEKKLTFQTQITIFSSFSSWYSTARLNKYDYDVFDV